MSQQILFAGIHSELTEINVLWADGDNVRHGSKVEFGIEGSDKSRTLCVIVNGVRVAVVPCSQTTQDAAIAIGRMIK